MIPVFQSRLAIVVLLLAAQISIVVIELLVFKQSVSTTKRYSMLRQWLSPIGIALLGIVLVPITFASPKTEVSQAATQCSLTVDADIAGSGGLDAARLKSCNFASLCRM